MLLDMSGNFQYIKVERYGRRHFCLQQNLLVLGWILFFNKDTLRVNAQLNSSKKSVRFVIRWLRYNFGLFRMKIVTLILFAGYKYQLRNFNSSVVILPFYGQICVPVHKGYKIFDLRREAVIKVFDNDVKNSSISNEVERLKIVSHIDFAPSIRKSNVSEGWYEEDYFCGALAVAAKPLDSKALLKIFYDDVAEPLKELILFQPSKTRYATEYLMEIIKNMEISRLSNSESKRNEITEINGFLDLIVKYFQKKEDCPVFQVFTHGDFCPENMMNTKQGLKVFDWESAKYRSALFDFYSYFFHRSFTHKVPLNVVVSEVSEALPFLVSMLEKKVPDLSSSLLHLEKVYRRIYYVERICMLAERAMTDKNLNILQYLLRYLELFYNYEEMLVGRNVAVNYG